MCLVQGINFQCKPEKQSRDCLKHWKSLIISSKGFPIFFKYYFTLLLCRSQCNMWLTGNKWVMHSPKGADRSTRPDSTPSYPVSDKSKLQKCPPCSSTKRRVGSLALWGRHWCGLCALTRESSKWRLPTPLCWLIFNFIRTVGCIFLPRAAIYWLTRFVFLLLSLPCWANFHHIS